MKRISDKELRRLLRDLASNSTVDEITARLTLQDMAEQLAREVIALRRVARAAKAFIEWEDEMTEYRPRVKLIAALDAYERRGKGKDK